MKGLKWNIEFYYKYFNYIEKMSYVINIFQLIFKLFLLMSE